MKKKNKLFTYTMTLLLCGSLLLTSCEKTTNEEDNTTESSETTHTHSFSDEWSYDEYYHWHDCECGEVSSNHERHDFIEEVVAATCVEDGVKTYTCRVCSYSYSELIPASGEHEYSEYSSDNADSTYHWITCSICGDTIYTEHTFEDKYIAPDCANAGYRGKECLICGYQLGETIEATGEHDYQATGEYDENGHTVKCSQCGDIQTQSHQLNLDTTKTSFHNCASDGHYFYYCELCDYEYDIEVQATGEHTFGKYYEIGEEGDDYQYHYRDCEVCGYTEIEEHVITKFNYVNDSQGHQGTCDICGHRGHILEHDWVFDDNDITEQTHNGYCLTCGSWMKNESTKEHTFVSSVSLEPTCTEYGELYQECTVCGYSKTTPIDPTGEHSYIESYLSPTCEDYGYYTYTCSMCGYSYNVTAEEPLGHTYEGAEYLVSNEGDGGHYRLCSRCNEPSPVEAHEAGEAEYIEAPTCTTDGLISYNCIYCGTSVNNETVAALGHDYVYTDNGNGTHTCVCSRGDTESVTENHDAVLTAQDDSNYHYSECSKCGHINVDDMIQHTFDLDSNICTECGFSLPVKYTLDESNKEATITGVINLATSSNFTIQIPTKINDYTVTSIDNNGSKLDGIDGINHLIIPGSVTKIGNHAFDQSHDTNLYLTSVEFESDGLLEIGDYAFYNTHLSSIDFPATLESIGQNAFLDVTSLTGELVIPDSVTSIGNSAFNSCNGIKGLIIGNSLSSLGNTSFAYCYSLSYVYFNENCPLKEFKFNTFYDCSNLASIVLPTGLESIGSSCFYNCKALSSIVLPTSVKTIASQAFCTNDFSEGNGIECVYYLGTTDNYTAIEIGETSSAFYAHPIEAATWYFYDEEGTLYGSDQEHLYWHYVDGSVVLWGID